MVNFPVTSYSQSISDKLISSPIQKMVMSISGVQYIRYADISQYKIARYDTTMHDCILIYAAGPVYN